MRRTLVMVVLLGACSGTTGDPTTSRPSTTAAAATTSTEYVSPPTAAPPASTTTTTEATTTTVQLTPEHAIALFVLNFENSRDTILEVWSDDINIETVDSFVTEATNPDDAESLTVILDVTSGWASEDNQHDAAWEITRAMAVLWGEEEGVYYHELWQPAFRLVNSGRTYECPAELMVRFADSRASRSEWGETCAA